MFRADDLLSLRRGVLINHLALIIHDLQDGNGGNSNAAVGEHRIHTRHFQHTDIAAAEREREAIIVAGQRSNAKAIRHGNHAVVAIHTHKLQRLHGGNVKGIRQRGANRNRPVKFIIVIIWNIGRTGIIRIAGRREFRGHIPNQGGRSPTFFKSRNVIDRFDG